jgi:hypothetical protein
MEIEKEKKGCCCGETVQTGKNAKASCCGGPEVPVMNASCCGPSSPGLARVRLFILGFFVLAAVIVLIYGAMQK